MDPWRKISAFQFVWRGGWNVQFVRIAAIAVQVEGALMWRTCCTGTAVSITISQQSTMGQNVAYVAARRPDPP